jgi:hypothetical protein
MTSCIRVRARAIAAAVVVLTVIAACVGLLILAVKAGAPNGWWPHTGRAFTADTRALDRGRCDLIAGPAKRYCERHAQGSHPAAHQDLAGAAFKLVPAGAGVAALVVWRLRNTAGQRRR